MIVASYSENEYGSVAYDRAATRDGKHKIL